MTPSALSYIGYALLNDLLKFDEDVASVLTQLEASDECRKACLYNYNIPDHLRALTQELKTGTFRKGALITR
jgi:hypothetical protein